MSDQKQRYSLEEIQDSAELATQPQDMLDGSLYIPPRRIPPELVGRVLAMMTVLGTDDPRMVLDAAMEVLDWALDRREAGLEVGAATENEFEAAPIDFLQKLNVQL